MFKIVNQNLSHVLHVLQNMLEEMCITLNYSIYWCIHGNNVQFTLLLSNIHDSSPGKKKELLIFIFRDINFFLFKQKIILFFSFYFTNITFPCFIPRPLKFKKKMYFLSFTFIVSYIINNSLNDMILYIIPLYYYHPFGGVFKQ